MTAGSTTKTTLGGHFGGGVDTHVARSFSIGIDVGYNAMMNFDQPVRRAQQFQRPAGRNRPFWAGCSEGQ